MFRARSETSVRPAWSLRAVYMRETHCYASTTQGEFCTSHSAQALTLPLR